MEPRGWGGMGGGGGLAGSGSVIAAGGGRPRCDVDMVWGPLAGSRGVDRSNVGLGE